MKKQMADNKSSTTKAVNVKKQKTPQEKRGTKVGILVFAIVFALYAVLFGLYRVFDYVLCIAISFLLSKVASIMATGLDLRTEEQKQMEEPDPIIITGNAQADEVIARGQDMVRQIREENRRNPEPVLTGKMNELERITNQILKTLQEKPEKASQVRRFMDYYLPTTLKMLENFRKMDERELAGEDAINMRKRISDSVDVVIAACQRLLDNLYKDDYLDVSTDIDVLKQMLKRDGLTDGDFINVAAQTMATSKSEEEKPQ